VHRRSCSIRAPTALTRSKTAVEAALVFQAVPALVRAL
jgi:hypothetical protein